MSQKREKETAMIPASEVKQLVNDLFEEEALVIGGLVAVHPVDDDIVRRLMRNIDEIRERFIRRIEGREGAGQGRSPRPNLTPHPAIEEFIRKVRRA